MNNPVLSAPEPTDEWKKTACILCSINCGLEVQTGGEDGRQIVKIRGDDDHPLSKGYVCEKSQRMNYYQHGADRLTSPMLKRDGKWEEVDWSTALEYIAGELRRVRDAPELGHVEGAIRRELHPKHVVDPHVREGLVERVVEDEVSRAQLR